MSTGSAAGVPTAASAAAAASALLSSCSPEAAPVVGSLRIRVAQATDLPGPAASASASASGESGGSSWLRYPARRLTHSRTARPSTSLVCVLLQCGDGRAPLLATATLPEFFVDGVSSEDAVTFFCMDRTKNTPHAHLPLQREDASACPGFIGRVSVPLVRLPEGEEVEQWYPLVPKEAVLPLRTALRIALCFTPSGSKAPLRIESTAQLERRIPGQVLSTTTAATTAAATEISSASPVAAATSKLRIQIPSSSLSPAQSPVSIQLKTGVVDYVIIVGSARDDEFVDPASRESSLLFRYPASDRVGFPLPTKIEWFCFPGGPEVVAQLSRPRSKLFSFVLVGGDDGTSRTYAVCLTVYHRPRRCSDSATQAIEWHATCVAFLTRVPLIEELEQCLLAFAHAWLGDRQAQQPLSQPSSSSPVTPSSPEELLVALCHRVLIPIRGVFGVRFSVANKPMSLTVPANVSIYSSQSRNTNTNRPSLTGRLSPTKSPTTNFINIQQGFQPLVYSLAPIFQLFDIKTVVHLVALILCEYRVLIHSNHFSLLCPFAEGLCALIYPFRWQHPYVPILPRVLSEYLQAPLPYILGVHTSWLPALLENGRPEHLVLVDIDRGTIQLQESTSPMLPCKLTKGLCQRIKRIIHPDVFDDTDEAEQLFVSPSRYGDSPLRQSPSTVIHWDANVEKQVRVEFVCFLAAMLMGYRDCLLFVNQKLPVFNKRRYFATCAGDSEVVPFVTKLFCTQAFQSFLENHSAAELSVFHSVYLTFSRSKDLEWPLAMPLLSISSHAAAAARSGRGFPREQVGVPTPVFTMPQLVDSDGVASSAAFAAPNSQDAMEHDESAPSTSGEQDPASPWSLGEQIEEMLEQLGSGLSDPFVASVDELEAQYVRSTHGSCHDYKQVAQAIGVEPRLLEENAELFRDPHQTNQNQALQHAKAGGHSGLMLGGGGASNARGLSNDEERTEQVLHKCLTSVFASDDMLTPEDIRVCELRFRNQYARDLFVLILMQPSHQYVEMSSATGSGSGSANSGTWYNPKGSGNCIGDSGFQVLSRLSSTLMDQCAVHEDFTNARGMLQVAFQYYRFVEDKHSGVGFAKKEYLVTPLRLRPICRSLDMWQHAFMREIDAAMQADPTAADENDSNAVADELFFSIVGSLVYDMLTVEMPVPKVHAFVSVMCSTYQKDKDLFDTLKQLVENVFRALEMSKDASKLPPQKTPAVVMPVRAATASTASLDASASAAVAAASSVASSRQYDLDTVIRRKMSTTDVALFSRSPASRAVAGGTGADQSLHASASTTPLRRRAVSSSSFSSTVLLSQSAPILSMDNHQGRVACGLADASIAVVETASPDRYVRLEGHTDAVVAVQLRGNTLVSGSRDHTLRAWDLRATPKKRQLFSFFSGGGSGQRQSLGSSSSSDGGGELDGASVSRKSVVWRGHSDAITCLEMGRQLATDRSLIGSGSDDGTIRLWDTTREASVALLGNGKAGVSCLRFLALYDYLASGCRENSLKVWDLGEAKLRTSVPAHRGAVLAIQVTGDRLVTASNDRTVKVWDAHFRGGASYAQALREHGGPVRCVCLGGPADPNICTGAADGVVRVWDLRFAGKGPRLALAGHAGPVTSLQRDFTKLVSGGEDGALRVWDLHSGACVKDARRAHLSGVTSAALRDSLVYSSAWDGAARLWDLEAALSSAVR